MREESLDQLGGDAADWPDRGAADGNSVQPDSDFGMFLYIYFLIFSPYIQLNLLNKYNLLFFCQLPNCGLTKL